MRSSRGQHFERAKQPVAHPQRCVALETRNTNRASMESPVCAVWQAGARIAAARAGPTGAEGVDEGREGRELFFVLCFLFLFFVFVGIF
jgi:hypothetical protein